MSSNRHKLVTRIGGAIAAASVALIVSHANGGHLAHDQRIDRTGETAGHVVENNEREHMSALAEQYASADVPKTAEQRIIFKRQLDEFFDMCDAASKKFDQHDKDALRTSLEKLFDANDFVNNYAAQTRNEGIAGVHPQPRFGR